MDPNDLSSVTILSLSSLMRLIGPETLIAAMTPPVKL